MFYHKHSIIKPSVGRLLVWKYASTCLLIMKDSIFGEMAYTHNNLNTQ